MNKCAGVGEPGRFAGRIGCKHFKNIGLREAKNLVFAPIARRF
jgi:hypothetical protein